MFDKEAYLIVKIKFSEIQFAIKNNMLFLKKKSSQLDTA